MKMKNNLRSIFMYIIGCSVIIGFFGLIFILIRYPVIESNRDILNLVVGALIGSFGSIVSYFFGSSIGSKDKTELLNKKNEQTNNSVG